MKGKSALAYVVVAALLAVLVISIIYFLYMQKAPPESEEAIRTGCKVQNAECSFLDKCCSGKCSNPIPFLGGKCVPR